MASSASTQTIYSARVEDTRLKEQIHNSILNVTHIFHFSSQEFHDDKYALYKSIAYRFHVCVKFKFKFTFDLILVTGK